MVSTEGENFSTVLLKGGFSNTSGSHWVDFCGSPVRSSLTGREGSLHSLRFVFFLSGIMTWVPLMSSKLEAVTYGGRRSPCSLLILSSHQPNTVLMDAHALSQTLLQFHGKDLGPGSETFMTHVYCLHT